MVSQKNIKHPGFSHNEKLKLLECDIRLSFNRIKQDAGLPVNPRRILEKLKIAYEHELSKENRPKLIEEIKKLGAKTSGVDTVSVNTSEYAIIQRYISILENKYDIVKSIYEKTGKGLVENYDFPIITDNVRFKMWFKNLTTPFCIEEQFYKSELIKCETYLNSPSHPVSKQFGTGLVRVLNWEINHIEMLGRDAHRLYKSGLVLTKVLKGLEISKSIDENISLAEPGEDLIDNENSTLSFGHGIKGGEENLAVPLDVDKIQPYFIPKEIENIFAIFKDYFLERQHAKLKELLQNGNDTSEPLVFLSIGNRLADAFKKMIENKIVTRCNKRQLENWIVKNFKYKTNDQVKNYTERYLNDLISSTEDKCKKPILEIIKEEGSLTIVKN